MNEQLKINVNYGSVFGLDEQKNQMLIYMGGVSFKAVSGDREKIFDSQDSYDKIMAHINSPSIHMGM